MSEFGPKVRAVIAGGAALACAVGIAAYRPDAVSAELASPAAVARDCDSYPLPSSTNNHEREVCIAYKFNAFEVALGRFYQFGNNRNSFTANKSRQHLETRYFDGPLAAIENRVDSWQPKTTKFFGNHVNMFVALRGQNPITANLKADRAVVRVRQSVDVYSGDTGEPLYQEAWHAQDVTMCRGKLPEDKGIFGIHPLHLWYVVKNSADNNFPCIAYDKAHDIQP